MALSKFCAVVWMWFWNEAENKFLVKQIYDSVQCNFHKSAPFYHF